MGTVWINMRQSLFILSALFVQFAGQCLATNFSVNLKEECKGIGQCFCSMENGQKIDLTNLGNYVRDYAPGGVLTANDQSMPGVSYSYNPCVSFDLPTGCQEA